MHIHILGICGTFMGGLAALARELGHTVTGCDTGVYPPMSDQLRALGIELIEGYGAEQLALAPDMFVVGNVVSRARRPDGTARYPADGGNPRCRERPTPADRSGCPTMCCRAGMCWRLPAPTARPRPPRCWPGSWSSAGLAPGFLIGGVPMNFDRSARLGGVPPAAPDGRARKPLFVIEADEYDTAFFDKRSKFVHYRPRTVDPEQPRVRPRRHLR